MMTAAFTRATQPLVFNWESPRRRNIMIGGFLAASLLAHAACFYIFQIVYPPTVALLPPEARLSLIPSDSEEGRTLLRWIEAEDPALASTTRRPPDAKAYSLPKVQHVPSYFATEPALKELPPLAVDLRIPSSQPAGAVPITHRQGAPTIAAAPTSVLFSNEIESLGKPELPPPQFGTSSNQSVEAVRFRIAVSSYGEIRYCLPLNSSGDHGLDGQARNYLALCRFPPKSKPSEQSLTWGIATIEWGNDLGRSQPASTGTVSP
jgi:hypothetical protein